MSDHDCVCDVPVHRWDYDLCKECGRTISDPLLNQIATLEAALATATEAAEAARDKALEEAIAEVTHVTSTAHDARVLALAAKRIELLRAKLRAAKEGR